MVQYHGYCMYVYFLFQANPAFLLLSSWLTWKESAYCWAGKRGKQREGERKTLVLSLCFSFALFPVGRNYDTDCETQTTFLLSWTATKARTENRQIYIVHSIQGTYDEIPNSCKNFLLRLARFGWIVSLAPAARECACKTIKYPLLYR